MKQKERKNLQKKIFDIVVETFIGKFPMNCKWQQFKTQIEIKIHFRIEHRTFDSIYHTGWENGTPLGKFSKKLLRDTPLHFLQHHGPHSKNFDNNINDPVPVCPYWLEQNLLIGTPSLVTLKCIFYQIVIVYKALEWGSRWFAR